MGTRHSWNIRGPPLPADYFSEHLGVYRPVLAALESLNRAVLTAMDTTKLVSGAADGGGPRMRAGGVRRLAEPPLSWLGAVELEAWVQILSFPLSVYAPLLLWISASSSVNWA